MPEKKQKTGKQRRDKYYNLAKATGYRARSSFKLLQLNRKFNFLQKSRICVDLCAAPGSWLQVAQQHMPQSSVIIGVDLVLIRPIPNVITIQSDITTDDCRNRLKKEIGDWKADCFLHDGAPNVGKSWLHDAYNQNTLTLQAFKLACEMLRKGGWFITKVFRSNDYNSLMYVFGELFEKVHGTKPKSSRNESAEIFVVCQGFKAPDKIDKKFFDIKAVFEGVDTSAEDQKRQTHLKDFDKPKKKKAEGYEDTPNVSMHVKKTMTEFLACGNPLNFIAGVNQLVFDNEYLLNHELTTEEIVELVKDLKVIGPSDAKTLKRWYNKMSKKLHKEIEEIPEIEDDLKKENDEDDSEDDSESEMKEINEKLLNMKKSEVSSIKRKKKLKIRALKKLKQAIADTAPSAALGVATGEDPDLFSLSTVQKQTKVEDTEFYEDDEDSLAWSSADDTDSEGLDLASGDEDEELERKREERIARKKKKSEAKSQSQDSTILKSVESKSQKTDRKVNMWFTKSIFDGFGDGADDITTTELDLAAKKYKLDEAAKKEKDALVATEGEATEETGKGEAEAELGEVEDDEMVDDEDDDVDDDDSSSDDDSTAYKAAFASRGPGWTFVDSKNKEPRVPTKENGGLTAEELAVATEMSMSRKKKREYIENSYNRYTFDDEEGALPDWFIDDEKVHQRPDSGPSVQGSENKELVEFYKNRAKSANVRTIKKVAEAKARKKKKLVSRRDKARKTADGILAQADVSEREKSALVKSVYSKAGLSVSGGKLKEQRKEKPTIVRAKKGVGKRVARPAGVKGIYKVVDKRQKNDMRHEKGRKKRATAKHGKQTGFKNKMNNRGGANAQRSFKSKQNQAKFSKKSGREK